MPILQLRKLMCLIQGNKANKKWSQDVNLGFLAPKSKFSASQYTASY